MDIKQEKEQKQQIAYCSWCGKDSHVELSKPFFVCNECLKKLEDEDKQHP